MESNQREAGEEEGRGAFTLRSWMPRDAPPGVADASVDCGWGDLIFAHTYRDLEDLTRTLCDEPPGRRNIALYVPDPHVVLSLAPQQLFLDPSHTYRYSLEDDPVRPADGRAGTLRVRRVERRADAREILRIYEARGMICPSEEFVWSHRNAADLVYFVAEHPASGQILGTVMGIDHVVSFQDPERGSSLWCLAVCPTASQPGVGSALTGAVVRHFSGLGRAFVDLSVLHDNEEAIAMYEKMGWSRVPVFCVKRKNAFNEPLFCPPPDGDALNPYAEIIAREARRRGILVEVLKPDAGIMQLTFGGRSILCRESLSEMTSGMAFALCDDKQLTRWALEREGLPVPVQEQIADASAAQGFLENHGSIVIKPARGEQGKGVSVDLRRIEDLERAVEEARRICPRVLAEEYFDGEDLRVVVIDYQVVAAAVRRPPAIVGTGEHEVEDLIRRMSRRREAATGGESSIPLDGETRRCVSAEGYDLASVLPKGERLTVRKTANLHTGGTLHDATDELNADIADAAVRTARALRIPVVGVDFRVRAGREDEFVILEANERVGLANHEPQPTAERFVDLLFPDTAAYRSETVSEART